MSSRMMAPIVAPMMAGTMPEPRWMPKRGRTTPDQSTDNADSNIGDETEACPLHDLASEPSRNKANHQDNE
jgi:hypothetical protein